MATTSVVVDIVEHPVFFDMPSLLENATAEAKILEGLFDLQYNNYSDLYFLFTGSFAFISHFQSQNQVLTWILQNDIPCGLVKITCPPYNGLFLKMPREFL